MKMKDDEYYAKMFPKAHGADCGWHCDQYWWECDCGATPVTELTAEYKNRHPLQSRPGDGIAR